MKSAKMYIFLGAVFLPLLVCFGLFAYDYRSSLSVPENPMPVLMYHNIVTGGDDLNGMTVTAEKLEQDLQYLADAGYETVLPRDIIAGKIPEMPVMITFDDGYVSNYELLFPLLKKYNMKAVISIIAYMPDIPSDKFCSWDMLREMSDSGLVEIASHTYSLHNLDDRGGEYDKNGVNGIARMKGENIEAYRERVMSDIEKSRSAILEYTGVTPCSLAYPYGESDDNVKDSIDSEFEVTFTTRRAIASYSGEFHDLPRITVTMDTDLEKTLHFVKE